MRTSETHAWHRATRVQQLYDAGRIGREELDAAGWYRDDYEVGQGARVGSGGSGGGLESDGRLDAQTRTRQAREAVGYDAALLDALVVRDEPWTGLAAILGAGTGGWGVERAQRRCVAMLDVLAQHYRAPRRQPSTTTREAAVATTA